MSSAPRIYTHVDLSNERVFDLDDNAFGHAIRALRLQQGDHVRVFNGDGHEYLAQLIEVGKKQAQAKVVHSLQQDPTAPLTIRLGQVMSKGDRMDFTIQKATELGINQITPLWSERCDVRLKGERLDKKCDHWQRVAISACEQSGRNVVPQIETPCSALEWAQHSQADLRLLLHPHQQQPLHQQQTPRTIDLLVGPEGGFSESEVAQLLAQQFTGLRLGPRILRTETAALAALSVLQYLWGDF
ncbi:MAG: 16S rRNA (uracil(1498)-N(3))-methyltransferase [Bacterioplanes sp.]|nr:16S rRNA (uracil(1498)-N(3))-methyltransferase [Bacterioplanes sp.]